MENDVFPQKRRAEAGAEMTRKELRRLSRAELLEMLIEQEEELNACKEQLAKAQAELANRRIQIANAGSVAEAALQLSGIFEAAQRACDLYTENVRKNNAAAPQRRAKPYDEDMPRVVRGSADARRMRNETSDQ